MGTIVMMILRFAFPVPFLASGTGVAGSIFSDANWVSIGDVNGTVFAAVTDGSGNLYIGGGTGVGSVSDSTIVKKWNGSDWNELGSGVNGYVRALAWSGSGLYAGGSGIAKWNGSGWSELGSGVYGGPGVSGAVWALAVSGSDLYVGGNFTIASGTPARNIAKWNGSSWSRLGSGIDGFVEALAVSGSDLYVGGSFTTAGVVMATNIAKWNGSNWSALGFGISGEVFALTVSGSDLYVGGNFTSPGGVLATNIAKWNGNNWSPLGSGTDGYVTALAVSGNDLYVGGVFTKAGGSPANRIAKWNGSSWSALGSGMTGGGFLGFRFPEVSALALSGSDLYAGGNFTTAGGTISSNLAHAYLERPSVSVHPSGSGLTLSWPVFYTNFALQQNLAAANTGTWSNVNYLLDTNGATKRATVPLTSTNQFFRLIGN